MARSGFIDWKRHAVDMDHPSPRFKIIQAPKLDSDVLREAIKCLKSPVVHVQIEVPVDEELKKFVADMSDRSLYRLSDLGGDITPKTKYPDQKAKGMFTHFFNKQARAYRNDPAALSLINQWKENVMAMPEAILGIWNDLIIATSVNAEDNISFPEGILRPHDHGSFSRHKGLFWNRSSEMWPGYVLNMISAADGTVFFDNERKDLFFGKGWTYNLFATKGHTDVEAAIHSEPFPFRSPAPEKRKGFITVFSPNPQIAV